MGKKYFISDTHIGGRGKIDDFDDKVANFCFLLKKIENDNNKNDPGELILLGDFFDFLEVEVQGNQFSNIKSKIAFIIKKISRRYPDLFKAIQEYIKSGQKIFYVCGNHDFHMLFPRIYQLVAQEFIPKDGLDPLDGFRLFQVNNFYASRKFKIYAEHGHRFDSENWHHKGMPECLGSLLVKNFLIKWEKKYTELDNMRPRGNMYFVIREECVAKGLNANQEIKAMLKTMNEVHKEYLHLCDNYNHDHKSVSDRANKIKILLSIYTNEDSWWDDVVNWAAEGSIIDALNENCTTYRKKAIELMNMNNDDNIASQKDLDFKPDHFIFGHTHFFDHREFDGGRSYINTASWLSTYFYDNKSKKANIDDVIAKAPVLIFNKAGEKPKLYDVQYDSVQNKGGLKEIHFEKIKEEYEKLGVIF